MDPETGRRTVNLHKDQLGKVDDVLVNGESVLNEDNEAEITIPEKVSDLPNDADYATKQEAQQMVDDAKIDTVSVDYQEDGGAPDASASFEDGELAFSLKNMKMKFSDLTAADKAELKGEKGDQGDSAVYNPDDPDTPDFVMANTTGQSTTKAMTQKAVTDELIKDDVVFDLSSFDKIKYRFSNDGEWLSDNNCNSCFINVSPGDVYLLKANENFVISYAFLIRDNHTETTPAYAGGATTYSNVSSGGVEMVTVPNDATLLYICLNIGANSYAPAKVAKLTTVKDIQSSLVNKSKQMDDQIRKQGTILGDVEELEIPIMNISWVQGSVNRDGSDYVSSVTLRSGFIYADDDKIRISCAEGYFIKHILSHNTASKTDVDKLVYWGNAYGGFDKTVTSYEFWGEGKFYRCTIGKVNGSGLTPSDAANVSLTSIETITKDAGGKVTFNDVAKKVATKKLAHIDYFYGFISYFQGGINISSSNAPTTYHRKYEIDDTSKVYYADLRVFPQPEKVPCGVAYYDSESNFICSQYISEGTAMTLEKARLNVPENTKYIYILGCDNTGDTGYVIPQLYVDEFQSKVSPVGNYLSPIAEFSFLGNGNTLVDSATIPVPGNSHILVKMSYDSWTMPDPEAGTYAIWTQEYFANNTQTQNRGWLQNEFEEIEQYEFITRKNTNRIKFSIRAVAGEVIHFSVFKIVDKKEDVNLKGTPPASGIIYDVCKVNKMAYHNISGISTAVEGEEVDSAWAAMFPSTYKPTGKPTQVIAMLHGAGGYVTPTVMGYSGNDWKGWRNAYLSAGFAVMEINGWGVSSTSDEKSTHWGCPAALETLDKAFETMRERYNVSDKMLIHGTSMGGATAWAYGLNYPGKVLAMGLFSPATIARFMLSTTGAGHTTSLTSWQYANLAEAVEEDFQRIVGFDPIIRALRFKDGLISPISQLAGHDITQYENSDEYMLVGQALSFPVRIWHGTSDATVEFALSQTIADAYQRGGQNVTLRSCPSKGHELCTGNVQYVIDEAVEYFKRFSE